MKRKTFYAAAFAAMGLLVTGCQKEEVVNNPNYPTESISMYIAEYSINGTAYREILHSEKEYNALLMRLMALAREGNEVSIQNGVTIGHGGITKDVVVYTTQDEKDAARWAKEMTDEGYKVTITFDSSTNMFTCVAVK